MPLLIKNESLSDSKVPGSTDLSVEFKSSYSAAQVTVTLTSKDPKVQFQETSSQTIVLATDHNVMNEYTVFSKTGIKIKGSLSENVAMVKFNVHVKDNQRNDQNSIDLYMNIIPT